MRVKERVTRARRGFWPVGEEGRRRGPEVERWAGRGTRVERRRRER